MIPVSSQPQMQPRGCFRLFVAVLSFLVLLAAGACQGAEGQLKPDEPPLSPAQNGGKASLRAGTLSTLKLYISQPGIYRLTAADLGLTGVMDWSRVRLRHRGEELPTFISPNGEALYFFARPVTSRYTREDVVWIEPAAGPGRQMESVPGTPAGAQEITAAEVYVAAEENRLYQPLAEGISPWFWAQLAAPATWETELTLDNVVMEEAHLAVTLWAKTQAPAQPDHHWRLFWNGELVGDVTRDGAGVHVVEVPIPARWLRGGPNTLRLEAPGDVGAADISFVDRVVVTYVRKLVADGGRLVFKGDTTASYQVSGLPGAAQVFDVTDPSNPRRLVGVRQEGDTVLFAGTANHQYEVVTAGSALRPDRVEAPLLVPDLRALKGGDYVAIGPADLLEPLAPLMERRAVQGLLVQTVPVEAVFDQFGNGLPDPEAVRAFLAHAIRTWNPPPRYVLLVGDTTYDLQGWTVPPEANRMPTFMVSTAFGGETASDVAFAQINDDPWPDVALGRVPAATPEQVAHFVTKTLAYEDRPADISWRRRVLAVADGQEPQFADDARRFLDHLDGFESQLLSPPAGTPDGAAQVEAALNAGAFLVAYFGHGSVTQWGKDRLFTADQVSGLRNTERLPVIVQMTCLTGLFTHPQVTSLAETLLWAEGGAVAVLAPTSLTLPTDQTFLADALAETLNASPQRLGDWFLEAQRRIPPDREGGRDVLLTFLLFGDPALPLAR